MAEQHQGLSLYLKAFCNTDEAKFTTEPFDPVSLPTHKQYSACLRSVCFEFPVQNVRSDQAFIHISADKGKKFIQIALANAHVSTGDQLAHRIMDVLPKNVKNQISIDAAGQRKIKIEIKSEQVVLRMSSELCLMLGFSIGREFKFGAAATNQYPVDLFRKYHCLYLCMPTIVDVNNLQKAVLRPILTASLSDSLIVASSFIDDFFVRIYANYISLCEIQILDCNFDPCYLDVVDREMSAVVDIRPRYAISL